MGLFSNIVTAIDRRIVGSARSTVSQVKDRLFNFDLTSGRSGFHRNKGKIGGVVVSDFDARSMSAYFAKQDFEELGRFNTGSLVKHNPYKKFFVRLDYKNHVGAMPPMADNIVDPPPFMDERFFQIQPSSFGSGLVGKCYAKLVMERGTYLSLSPLKLKAEPFKNLDPTGISQKISSMLDEVWGSLNIPKYSYEAKIETAGYWKDVCVHARASLMLLGLGDYTDDTMSEFLPEYIVYKLGDRYSYMGGNILDGEPKDDESDSDNKSWFQSFVDKLGIGGTGSGNSDRTSGAGTAGSSSNSKASSGSSNKTGTGKKPAIKGSAKAKNPEIKKVNQTSMVDLSAAAGAQWGGAQHFTPPSSAKKAANPYPLSKFGKKANELAAKAKDLHAKAQKSFDNLQKGYQDMYEKAKAGAERLDKMAEGALKNAKDSMRAFMGTHGGDVGLALYDKLIGTTVEQAVDGVKQLSSNITGNMWNMITGPLNSSLLLPGGLSSLYKNGDEFDLNDASIANFMRYILNIDLSSQQVDKRFPFVTFYCDGPIEKSFSSSFDISESDAAAATTHYLKGQFEKGLKAAVQSAGMTEMFGDINGADLGDAWKELRFHDYRLFKTGFNLASQTVIPKVIKGNTLGENYTATIRLIGVGTDRWSLFRLQFEFCKLIPFIFAKQEKGAKFRYIIPQQPYYCAAFSKGVMNLGRAAIESCNVKVDSTYNTTEGIASDMTITLNIVPLINVTVAPQFGFLSTDDTKEGIISAMFTPTSSFNMLATLAGHNTVFTKVPLGLFDYYIKGKPKAIYQNVTNIMRIGANAYQDISINSNFNFKRNLLTR